MSWAARTMFGFDIESTGVDVLTDRIVTSTIVQVTADSTPAVTAKSWLVNPGIPIPIQATEVHGISNETAATGMDPAVAVEQIAHFVSWVLACGHPLVAFNAGFDLSMLEAECRRHDLPTLHDRLTPEQWHAIVDPMVLGKGIDTITRNFRKGRKYTLPALCERYGVPFTETHDATADAIGAVGLARALAESDLMIAGQGPGALHQMQKTWRRDAANSLRAYFDKNGIEHDGVDPGWPLHTSLQAVSA